MLRLAAPHRFLILAAALAGCGGGAAPKPATVSLHASGAGQKVDATMSVYRLTDPASNALMRPAAGARFVQVEIEWSNRSGALPIRWARFSVLDQAGHAHAESWRLPERKLFQGRPDTPRIVPVGFALPAGAKPATLTMTSAVAALSLHGRWALSESGR